MPEMTPGEQPDVPVPLSPELTEKPAEPYLALQTPHEFRDDFVASVQHAGPADPVLLMMMQFEDTDDTRPMFDAMKDAKQAGAEQVEFVYDRVARRHIGVNGSQGFVRNGRTVAHRGQWYTEKGDKPALRDANDRREQLITDLEQLGITDPANKDRGYYERMSHNHMKLAVVGSVAWAGTMNLRGRDFEMSNFMLRVTDPQMVQDAREIFELAKQPPAGPDRVFAKDGTDGQPETAWLFDVGVKGQSIIYDTAMQMADSLQPGDEFTLIGQWPPVKMMYGPLVEKLDAKTANGARGTYLMNPQDRMHITRLGSAMLQRSITKRQAADPNMTAVNLARMTHAKAFLIKRVSGEVEVMAGSHNYAARTVKNGTRELAIWSKEPQIVAQIESYLEGVKSESGTIQIR